jgi:DNA-directed RNA polymerase subunit H (RpoH/RPB5)
VPAVCGQRHHHGRRPHWDFRLERDDVLVSWALPRGLPEDPAAKRLAMRSGKITEWLVKMRRRKATASN